MNRRRGSGEPRPPRIRWPTVRLPRRPLIPPSRPKDGVHFVHYLPRYVAGPGGRRPASPVDRSSEPAWERPAWHRSGAAHGPASRVRPGDTIWLFAQLHSRWGTLPPALDARIDVEAVTLLAGERRFVASRTSRWFPLTDSTAVLRALRTRRRDGASQALWRSFPAPVGAALRRMRTLDDAAELARWEASIDERGYDFVSYRLKDGTRPAFELVRRLVTAGRAVFWDRWSLPRRLAEGRETVADEVLERHLLRLLHGARRVWGVESPLYGDVDSYSAREREAAAARGTYQPWDPPAPH